MRRSPVGSPARRMVSLPHDGGRLDEAICRGKADVASNNRPQAGGCGITRQGDGQMLKVIIFICFSFIAHA